MSPVTSSQSEGYSSKWLILASVCGGTAIFNHTYICTYVCTPSCVSQQSYDHPQDEGRGEEEAEFSAENRVQHSSLERRRHQNIREQVYI